MSAMINSSRLAKDRCSVGPLMPIRLTIAFSDNADTPAVAICFHACCLISAHT